MKNNNCILAAAAAVLFAAGAFAGEKVKLADGWKFRLEGSPDGWREVTIPHDWSIEGAPYAEAPSRAGGGFYPCGAGVYATTISLSRDDLGKDLQLYFEGVYREAEVLVNGKSAGSGPFYGYTGFRVRLNDCSKDEKGNQRKPLVHVGENKVLVYVNNANQPNCRWYSGSGIFRHVWLEKRDYPFVEPDSVKVVTAIDSERKQSTATVSGTLIAKDGTMTEAKEEFAFDNPVLWSPETPKLYEVDFHGEKVRFGFRTVEWSAEKGFVLNGKSVDLHGGCVHHDHGPLGAASYDDAEYRKVWQLKNAGFNAVRTSHNPVSEAFLNACDELGLIVMDDMFDGWRRTKNPHDFGERFDKEWEKELRTIVKRDRNHASVLLWSIGNEILERTSKGAPGQAEAMHKVIDELDGSRPVTEALCCWANHQWRAQDDMAAKLDIVGYNYMEHKTEEDHKLYPERVIVYTETYQSDTTNVWKRIVEHPYVIGEFVWTAIDYLGESSIGRTYYEGKEPEGEHWRWGAFPWHGAYCGDIDLTGWRKPVSHQRETLWNENAGTYICTREPDGWKGKIKTTLWSVPFAWEHWNYAGWEGKTVQIEVYTRKPKVELFLNGKSMGVKEVSAATAWTATFEVPYEPGEVKAVAGDETVFLRTAGAPAKLRFTTEYDGKDMKWVVGEWVDKDGIVCDTDKEIDFASFGDVVATCSGDMTDCVPAPSKVRRAFHGRAMAVVRKLPAIARIDGTNPLVKTRYTADPAGVVDGDTFYVFMGHDADDARGYRMFDYSIICTKDMEHWEDLGTVMNLAETFQWARPDKAWASQAIRRNGKWYWYVCSSRLKEGGDAIGVAVADDVRGPWKDAIGGPLAVGKGFIDPSVFVDDDGQAWLFWGNCGGRPGCWYAPLKENMIELAGEIKEVSGLMDETAFGKPIVKTQGAGRRRDGSACTNFEEAPWIYKLGDTYYLEYAAGGVPEHWAYSTAKSIHGPWTYRGRIMDESVGTGTIHGGSVFFNGNWYMLRHDATLQGGAACRRSVCIERYSRNPDGSIPFIPATTKGVSK